MEDLTERIEDRGLDLPQIPEELVATNSIDVADSPDLRACDEVLLSSHFLRSGICRSVLSREGRG